MRAPALPAVDQPSPLQELVGRRDSGSRDAELRGEDTLRGKFRPRKEIVPLDGRGQRRSEPSLQRPLTQPPAVQRAAQLQGQPHANAQLIGPSHWFYRGTEISPAQRHRVAGTKESAMRAGTGLDALVKTRASARPGRARWPAEMTGRAP